MQVGWVLTYSYPTSVSPNNLYKMVQDGGKKKKNKNKNKKKQQQNEATSQPEAEQQTSVPLEVVAEPVKQHGGEFVPN